MGLDLDADVAVKELPFWKPAVADAPIPLDDGREPGTSLTSSQLISLSSVVAVSIFSRAKLLSSDLKSSDMPL